MCFADKALVSLEEAQSIEVLLFTSVVDGKPEWANFSAKSMSKINYKYFFSLITSLNIKFFHLQICLSGFV